jgi:hypothetical protein
VICPTCQTDHAHRSHRQGVKEYVTGLFHYYPYRCNKCGHRFFEFPPKPPKSEEKPTATEREIRATRRTYRWKSHRRDFLLYSSALLVFVGFLYYLTRYHGGGPSNGE